MNAASQLTLFAEVSHVRISRLREMARELKASVPVYGRNIPDLLAKYDHATQSWRTSQHCFIEGLTKFSETWPRSGMMQNGIAYRLPPLVPLTDATESGSWPTPLTKGYGHAAEGMVLNLINKIKDGTISKEEAEQMLGLPALENHRTWRKIWPTPTVYGNNNRKGISKKAGDGLATAVKMWPTPHAGLAKQSYSKRSGAYYEKRLKDNRQRDLALAMYQSENSGKLNPTWVEWLMGFPLGWTDLGNSEMQLFRKSQN